MDTKKGDGSKAIPRESSSIGLSLAGESLWILTLIGKRVKKGDNVGDFFAA